MLQPPLISSQLPRRSDLNDFGETCRLLYDIVRPRLYENLELHLAREWTSLEHLEDLLALGVQDLQYTKHISVVMRCDRLGVQDPLKDPAVEYDGDGLDMYEDDAFLGDHVDPYGQTKEQPGQLNCLMRLIIARIPKSQLRTFRYVLTGHSGFQPSLMQIAN